MPRKNVSANKSLTFGPLTFIIVSTPELGRFDRQCRAVVVDRHSGCLIPKAIIDYVRRRDGEPELLLADLESELGGIEKPLDFLSNPQNRVSCRVPVTMLANARNILGDDEVAFKVGFESIVLSRRKMVKRPHGEANPDPWRAIAHLKGIDERLNRTRRVEINAFHSERAVVSLNWQEGLGSARDLCRFDRGVIAALPTIWSLPPARVVETQCQFEGADRCRFEVRWENPSLVKGWPLPNDDRQWPMVDALARMSLDQARLEEKSDRLKHQNHRLKAMVDQLSGLQETGGAALAEPDKSQLGAVFLDRFLKATGHNRGLILEVDRRTDRLRCLSGTDLESDDYEAPIGCEVPLESDSLLAQVVASGEPIVAPDSLRRLDPASPFLRRFKSHSFVVLPLAVRGRVIGLLAADRTEPDQEDPLPADLDYLKSLADQTAIALEYARMYQELRQGSLAAIQALAQALEAKDPFTIGHSERVTHYAVGLARRLGLSESRIEQLKNMCLIHDIGKIGIDRHILNKPGRLKAEELALIRRHPVIGHAIIKPLNLSPEAEAVVRLHHLHYDGSGYPDDGPSGQDIPLEARLASICDAFEAMTTDRPYRAALSLEESIKRLKEGAGGQFDPDLVLLFVDLIQQGEFKSILQPTKSLSVA